MNKITLSLFVLFFTSIASNNWKTKPFSSLIGNLWYESFISQYKVPKLNPVKKIKIAVIDTGYSSPFQATNNIQNFGGHNDVHGTHITGIIYAINPYAEIYSYNVFQNGESSEETILRTANAINEAVKQKVDLINISMGGARTSIEELKALENAYNAGIVVVVAAGNSNENLSKDYCEAYPACNKKYFNNIIVVGNLISPTDKNPSSNFGEMVDVSFNGTAVPSLTPEGFTVKSGTSQATAFITGLLSLYLSSIPQKLSVSEVKELLISSETAKEQKSAGLLKVHNIKRGIASN